VLRPRASARPVERVARLTEDQTNLLSERVLDGLAEISDRISEMKAVVRDATGAQRRQAARQLRFLQAIADDHLAALQRLRAGGPTCRRCGARLDFEHLLAAPRAVACGGCRPVTRSRADRRQVEDGDA
jgi:hypothetical protein